MPIKFVYAKSKVLSKSRKSNQVPFPLPSSHRLLLRDLEIRDFENWRQAYSLLAPAQTAWDEGPWKDSELTKPKFREFLAKLKKRRDADEWYTFGVFREDDGVFVGYISFMDVSRGIFQNAFLGYRIFNPYWGQGYATQAVKLGIEIAFKELKLHRIEAGISPDNKASLKVAERAGLRCEGLSRKRLLISGKWEDLLLYAGTCEDFGRRFPKSQIKKSK